MPWHLEGLSRVLEYLMMPDEREASRLAGLAGLGAKSGLFRVGRVSEVNWGC